MAPTTTEPKRATRPKARTLRISYWLDDGWLVGYADDHPEYWTQGNTLDELKENIRSLVADIEDGDIPGVVQHAEMEMA